MVVLEEQRKSMVKDQRQMLSDLAVLRNRPILDCLTTESVYGITTSTYKQWKSFLRYSRRLGRGSLYLALQVAIFVVYISVTSSHLELYLY